MKSTHVGAFRSRVSLLAAFAVGVVLCAGSADAQLAITEVMSSASTNYGPTWVDNQSDFWELTNFGSTAIDLQDYTFADSLETPRMPLVGWADPDLVIAPGESVVFVRSKETTSVAQFRAWWGGCLESGVEVRMVPSTPGFDQVVDGLRVWDPALKLVDRVDFGVARRGVTFVPDAATGEFGAFSELGVCGACQAATADDLGSPGKTCGQIALRIVLQPVNQVVCAGTEAIFTTWATGLPQPKYQWYFNGAAIPGATAARYVLTYVQPSHAGVYQVVVFNGVEFVLSAAVTLTVTTNRSPPSIVAAPTDVEVYSNQTARFSVTACAFPLASYQWRSNGVSLGGETNPVLVLPACTPSMSGAQFCVRVANALGTGDVCARLTVTSKPRLRVTEIMAEGVPNCVGHTDWVELTNFDERLVNLLGYRFSDRPSFAGASVITQAVTLAPGQSAILVEGRTPEEFSQWWEADTLPPGLPVISYFGLGFSGGGDEIYLWNAAAVDPTDRVDSRSFEASVPGVSKRFGAEEADCYFGCDSVVSEMGAFRAAECGSVGSPGYTTNPPPRLVSIWRDALGAHLRWHGVEGRSYRVEYGESLQATGAGWPSLGDVVATNSLPGMKDTNARSSRRFYRVLEVAP